MSRWTQGNIQTMSNRKTPTEAQLTANQANAAHSTGPKTTEGKRIASHNALKNSLTGQTVPPSH